METQHESIIESIILDSSENISQANHIITKRLPKPYRSVKDRLGLCSVTIPYSWFNITALLNNTTGMSYTITGDTFPINYAPGFYQVSDLNNYMRTIMYANGHYLLDNTGEPVYFLSFNVNPIYYRVTLEATPVPSELPADWSNPAGLPLTGQTPQMNFGDTNFRKLLGFEPGTYPPASVSTFYQVNGQLAPVVDSAGTVVNVACNWLNHSRFSSRVNQLASFVPNVPFGEAIVYTPISVMMIPVSSSDYTEIEVSFYDQYWKPLVLNDTSGIQIVLELDIAR